MYVNGLTVSVNATVGAGVIPPPVAVITIVYVPGVVTPVVCT
jgi:hypothetical protein